MKSFTFGLLLFLAFGSLSGCGRRGSALIMGYGESLDSVAAFDDSTREEVMQAYGLNGPEVCFKYEALSFFFLNVWTFENGHVLCDQSHTEYVELAPEELEALVGMSTEELPKPFLYRFPLGLLAILGAIAAFGFRTWRRMQELGV